jgi:hypothetical protein
MAYTVNPPQVDEATGEFTGEPQVTEKYQFFGSPRRSVDLNPLNDELPYESIDVDSARQSVQSNIPIFREDATDSEIQGFWKSKRPLTDMEVDAIQHSYCATGNELIAQLLQYRLGLTDGSELPQFAQDELGLDFSGDEVISEVSKTDDFDAKTIETLIFDGATEPDAEIAQKVIDAEIGTDAASTTVSYLAHKYYSGEMTAEEAYEDASNSGIDSTLLYHAFTKLYNKLTN